MRRERGFWRAYQDRLNAFAAKAYDAAMVVSDGDRFEASKVRARARARYYWLEAGTNGYGHDVYFCWTLHPDPEGLFWSWREVHTSTEMRRDKYSHRKTKAAAAELARKRQNAFIDKCMGSVVSAEVSAGGADNVWE